MTDIAVIGAGNVGDTLARAWARAGHRVTFGARHPERVDPSAGVPAAPIADAIAGASVVVLALPAAAVGEVVQANVGALVDKIVIDATNNLTDRSAPSLSAIATLRAELPRSFAYRAFNSVGWENMADPTFGTETADLLYAGPDNEARATVHALIADVGFRPVYAGDTDDAHRAVDSLATLWFALAFGRGHGRRVAFRVLGDVDDPPVAP